MSANTKIAIGLIALALILALSWWFTRRGAAERSGTAGSSPLDEESMGYLRTNTSYLVWDGFHTRAEIIEMLPEVCTVDADESLIASLVDAEFARKRIAEHDWPGETDCDRLDAVFEEMHRQGIFAQQYVGYTQSDGFQDVSEALAEEPEGKYIGFCFYTAQDVEGLLDADRSLLLAFGDSDMGEQAVDVGRKICGILQAARFETEWNGASDSRIRIKNVDWKRRAGSRNASSFKSHQCASR